MAALSQPADAKGFEHRINAIWGLIHGFAVLALAGQICIAEGTDTMPAQMLARSVCALACAL